jgi:predicted nucleic acid-binding Zn ribbon protein
MMVWCAWNKEKVLRINHEQCDDVMEVNRRRKKVSRIIPAILVGDNTNKGEVSKGLKP